MLGSFGGTWRVLQCWEDFGGYGSFGIVLGALVNVLERQGVLESLGELRPLRIFSGRMGPSLFTIAIYN